MTDPTNADVLDFLRFKFARMDERFYRLTGDVLDLRVRMSSVESELVHLRINIAAVNSRRTGWMGGWNGSSGAPIW